MLFKAVLRKVAKIILQKFVIKCFENHPNESDFIEKKIQASKIEKK